MSSTVTKPKDDQATEKLPPLSKFQFGLVVALVVAFMLGGTALIIPIFTGVADNLAKEMSVKFQSEILASQNGIQDNKGAFSNNVDEVLVRADISYETENVELVWLTVDQEKWCGVAIKEWSRYPLLIFTVNSDNVPVVYKEMSEARDACPLP